MRVPNNSHDQCSAVQTVAIVQPPTPPVPAAHSTESKTNDTLFESSSQEITIVDTSVPILGNSDSNRNSIVEESEQEISSSVLGLANGVADKSTTPSVVKQQNSTNEPPNELESDKVPTAFTEKSPRGPLIETEDSHQGPLAETDLSPQGPLVETCFVCMKESTPEEPLTLCPDCILIYYCGEIHREIHRPHDTCFPFIVRSSQNAAGR